MHTASIFFGISICCFFFLLHHLSRLYSLPHPRSWHTRWQRESAKSKSRMPWYAMLWPNVRLVKWNYRTMVFPHLPCPAYPQYKNNIHTHTHTHGQWMFLWGSRYCITKINTKHNDTKQKERPKKISCRKLHLRHLLVAVSPFYSNLNAWLSSTHTFFILAATTSQYMWKKNSLTTRDVNALTSETI